MQAHKTQRASNAGLTDTIWALLLAAVVLLSRYFTRGSLYFADGPRIVNSIQKHTYVIQPPGYWVFAHLGAMFQNPAYGLAFWNMLFSAAGAAVFFLLCRKKDVPLSLALVAALAYTSIYFVWFDGVTHSSYASQLLFPPLVVYCFLRYQEKAGWLWLLASATAIAACLALRPTDGVLLAGLWVYLLFRYVKHLGQQLLVAAYVFALSLCWYIPTQRALRATSYGSGGARLSMVAQTLSPIVAGINWHSTANMVRVALPLMAAAWMLLPAIFGRRSHDDNTLLALWTLPGLAFLFFIYMSDASYLTFLVGGIILAAALSERRRLAKISLAVCLLWNAGLYFAARPIASDRLAMRALNFYVVKYCNYGVRHQWMSTLGGSGQVPHD